SRAVSLPASCWRRRRSSPPPSSARRSSSSRVFIGSIFIRGASPPEAPRHALSLAASPARSVRVARWLRSLAPLTSTLPMRRRAVGLLPVGEELLQADLGQRVIEERLDHRRRAGADVGAEARRFDDVHRAAR